MQEQQLESNVAQTRFPVNQTDHLPPQPAVEPHVSRCIDIIRGAASLGVIWGHSMYRESLMKLKMFGFSLPVELNGGVWVWIFLPISGYLVGRGFMAGGYEMSARGFGRFLFNRGLRILPLAYLALMIGVGACIIAGSAVPGDVVRQFLFVPHKNNISLVGPLWTVATELQFYVMAVILVPLVYGVWRAGGATAGALLFLGSVYAGLAWVGYLGDSALQPRTFFGNISFFMLGLLLARTPVIKLNGARAFKVYAVASLIVLVWWLQNFKPSYFWGWGDHAWPLGGTMVIAMTIVTVTLLASPDDQNRSRRKGMLGMLITGLGWCGFYCYGIYVWHAVLLALNIHLWGVPVGLARLGLLSLALPLAYLSYRFIEKPIMRFKMPHGSSA